jgi:hypothetical protein
MLSDILYRFGRRTPDRRYAVDPRTQTYLALTSRALGLPEFLLAALPHLRQVVGPHHADTLFNVGHQLTQGDPFGLALGDDLSDMPQHPALDQIIRQLTLLQRGLAGAEDGPLPRHLTGSSLTSGLRQANHRFPVRNASGMRHLIGNQNQTLDSLGLGVHNNLLALEQAQQNRHVDPRSSLQSAYNIQDLLTEYLRDAPQDTRQDAAARVHSHLSTAFDDTLHHAVTAHNLAGF